MRKVLKTLLYLVAGLGIVLEGGMVLSEFFRFEEQEVKDPRNYVLERRDKQGDLLSREQKVDGKWHGYQLYRDKKSGTEEGWFNHGVRVGLWTSRYANGSIRCERLFTNRMDPSAHAGDVGESIMLSRTDYKIDGTAIGMISNDFGVCVFMRDDGKRPFQYITEGITTNVSVSFHMKENRSPLGIFNVMITERVSKADDADTRILFHCYVDENGMITMTEERTAAGYHHAIRTKAEDGGSFLVEERGMPPFLLGETHYVIPSLVDCKPVFDLMVSCSNNMLVVTKRATPLAMGKEEKDRKATK